MGMNDWFPLQIDTGNAEPIALRYYRTSPKMQRIIDEEIESLLKHGFIEPSTSEWRSPVVMIPKKDGTYRMATDFRKINSVIKTQNFPIPRLEDVWDLIGESKPTVFSCLDLQSGFYQLKMDESTKHKSSFVTRNGQFLWNRVPFGMKTSPVAFCKTLTTALKGLLNTCCIVYVDDILCFSKDLESHKRDLQLIFDRLEKAGLTLKTDKCQFAKPSVKYLGHILSAEGVTPNPEKIEIIKNYPRPANVKQVRQFLGLSQYYRRFQKNYSKIAKPLHSLTQKDVEWNWTEECQAAFEQLRTNLIEPPILAYPDLNKPFILTTDASDVSIGYILSQKDENSRERVIAYGGRALRQAEKNYSVCDKEGLAVFCGFKAYNSYLYGNFTTVYTDNRAIKYIKDNMKMTGRVARWAIELQNYDYEVIHKKGVLNTNADAISRMTNLSEGKEEAEESGVVITINNVNATEQQVGDARVTQESSVNVTEQQLGR